MDINKYVYLWTNENYDYVLVKETSGYSIMNRSANEMLLIEDEKLDFSFNETLEKYKTKDSVIFEGDIKDVYLNMELLDGFTPDIHYTIVPDHLRDFMIL